MLRGVPFELTASSSVTQGGIAQCQRAGRARAGDAQAAARVTPDRDLRALPFAQKSGRAGPQPGPPSPSVTWGDPASVDLIDSGVPRVVGLLGRLNKPAYLYRPGQALRRMMIRGHETPVVKLPWASRLAVTATESIGSGIAGSGSV